MRRPSGPGSRNSGRPPPRRHAEIAESLNAGWLPDIPPYGGARSLPFGAGPPFEIAFIQSPDSCMRRLRLALLLLTGGGALAGAPGCRGGSGSGAVPPAGPPTPPPADEVLLGAWEGTVTWSSAVPASEGCVTVETLDVPVTFGLANGRFDPDYGDGRTRALYDLVSFHLSGVDLNAWDPEKTCADCQCERGLVTFDTGQLDFDSATAQAEYLDNILTITFPSGFRGDLEITPPPSPVEAEFDLTVSALVVFADPSLPLVGELTAGTALQGEMRGRRHSKKICPADGRCIRRLELLYTDGDCARSDHDLPPQCFACAGGGAVDGAVQIVASSARPPEGTIWFDGMVRLGETFTFDVRDQAADCLSGRTWFQLRTEEGLLFQEISICTHCEAPLAVRDRLAALRIVSAELDDGTVVPTDKFRLYETAAQVTGGVIRNVDPGAGSGN